MKIVWVNGCFDVMHLGHVRMLKFARSLGDYLVVGINSDDSVRRLKGDGRPIFTASERREMLLSLTEIINNVIIFEEDDPVAVMKRHDPPINIVVKGMDYVNLQIPEKDALPDVMFHFYDSGISSRTSKLVR